MQESNTNNMANKFLNMVVGQHRLLECITSDCDPEFCGHFWDELISLLDITLTFSIAWHPQTDGIAELINHTIE